VAVTSTVRAGCRAIIANRNSFVSEEESSISLVTLTYA